MTTSYARCHSLRSMIEQLGNQEHDENRELVNDSHLPLLLPEIQPYL